MNIDPLWGFLSWLTGASIRPPVECKRRSILASPRRLCHHPEQVEAPAGGLRPADTRQYLGGERQCATSLSVPPHCLFSYGLTRSCNCSSPTSHTQTHPRHTCTLGIHLYAQKPHTCTRSPHIFQLRIQLVMAVCPCSFSSTPSPFLFWQPLKLFCL